MWTNIVSLYSTQWTMFLCCAKSRCKTDEPHALSPPGVNRHFPTLTVQQCSHRNAVKIRNWFNRKSALPLYIRLAQQNLHTLCTCSLRAEISKASVLINMYDGNANFSRFLPYRNLACGPRHQKTIRHVVRKYRRRGAFRVYRLGANL